MCPVAPSPLAALAIAGTPFAKYHGLGNDFVIVDIRDDDVAPWQAAAVALCDRHRGIGADGLLLLTALTQRPRMVVINADGSRAGMCGNGLRCFVHWLDDQGLWPPADGGDAALGDARGAAGIVETDAGPLRCWLRRLPPAGAAVTVAMGQAAWEPAAVPVQAEAPLRDARLTVGDRDLALSALHMGNPHWVTFEPLTAAERAVLGPTLERDPRMPARANVEFCRDVRRVDGGFAMTVDVFERGCGWTQACGTGATAAVVAAVATGRIDANSPVAVQLPGGVLAIRADDAGRAWMQGPSQRVFAGTVQPGFVAAGWGATAADSCAA